MTDASLPTPRALGHEVADISGRRIAWLAVALAVALVVVALAAWAAHRLLSPDRTSTQTSAQAAGQPRVQPRIQPARQASTQPIVASAPRLQTAPTLDLEALRRQKGAMLDEYRWLDQNEGVVQIPIERAMQLIVERSASRRPDAQRQTEASP